MITPATNCSASKYQDIEVGEAGWRRLSDPLIGPDQVLRLQHLVQHPLDVAEKAVFDAEDGAVGVVDAEGDIVVLQQVFPSSTQDKK